MMRPTITTRLALTSLLLIGAGVHGEPTPLVSKLMGEPVSMLTFGLARLNEGVGDAATSAGFTFGFATYDYDSNEIRLAATAGFGSPLVKQCANDQLCEKLLRDSLQVFASKYANRLDNGKWVEYVTAFFTQAGYTERNFHNGKSLDAAVEELGQIVKITGRVITATRIYECKRDLKSTDVFCSSKPLK
jgi:hypothetical protein